MKQFFRPWLLGLALTGLASAALSQGAPQRQIQMNGEARIEVQPDVAQITIGVTTEGAEPLATMDANSAAIRKLIEFAGKSGVEKVDIRTQSVNVSPKMQNKRNPDGSYSSVQAGYTASNMVSVNLRDISKIGAFTRQVLELGANRIQGVAFTLADPQPILDQARVDALKDARRKAEQLAGAAGARLGPVLRIAHPPREEIRRSESHADLGRARMPLKANVPIEAGLITIATEIDVVWALE